LSAFEQLSRSRHPAAASRCDVRQANLPRFNEFLRHRGRFATGWPRGTARAIPARMTHRNVETVIGRLATDPGLRRRFAEDPALVLRELKAQGIELTSVELDALAATDSRAIRSFAEALDRRIRRADEVSESDTNQK